MQNMERIKGTIANQESSGTDGVEMGVVEEVDVGETVTKGMFTVWGVLQPLTSP